MNRGKELEWQDLGCVRSWVHSSTVREKGLGGKKRERKERKNRNRGSELSKGE